MAILAILAVACSSSSSPSVSTTKDAGVKHPVADAKSDTMADSTVGDGSGAGGGSDAHPDAIIDPMNCVAPGTASSENGIGGYCSPKAGQCLAGLGGVVTLCTADLYAPSHEWFCTISCGATSDCGGSGSCLSTPFGQICVPAACAHALGDAASLTVDAGDAGDAGDAAAPHDGAAKHDGASPHDATSDSHTTHDAAHDSEVDAHRADAGDARTG